jgi:DNA polymerase-3 subunit gamma/tau
MAKALLCSNGPTSKPCEVCDNCKSANSNRHLDIIEMDAASNRGIDDIKDLIEHTKYKPSSARFKVFIIDEVHMLTTQAFNALLKTLEEPPGFVKFILATTDPLKLPATILSRTQHFRFNKIAISDVIHHLAHILNEENINYEKDALEILARTGQGSLRDTLTLLDQAIIFSKGRINTVSVVDMLGLIDPKLMDNIFSIILNKGDINQIIKDLESYEVSQICDEMTIYLKDKMLSKDTKFDLLLFDRFFRILSDAKHLLAINSDGGFVLILTFMKMIEATNLKTIDDIINQVEKIEVRKEAPVTKTIEKPIEKVIEKIEPKVVETPPVTKAVFEEPETKIEEVTPFDEVLIQSNTIMDLGMVDSVEVVNYSTPFDDLPTVPATPIIKEIEIEKSKEIAIEPIIEHQVPANIFEEIEVVPIEDPFEQNDDIQHELYEQLTAKVYDRDPDLGECFEKNFIFNGFENNKLFITSYAQDEERKFLYKHFGIIKTFAQDIFGNDVELDFKKEEPSVLENQKIETQKQEENSFQEEIPNDTGSMIEEIEMGSGCVADMNNSTITQPSQKELELNDILNSKMLDKAKELFDIKKITVKSRS